mmetsp:Transcript_25028/g.57790  ORF Transcript_25028/g.57790 Transcript_25028/m.57790 type:complete len:93 (-) Transcript_25028:432-710(-)
MLSGPVSRSKLAASIAWLFISSAKGGWASRGTPLGARARFNFGWLKPRTLSASGERGYILSEKATKGSLVRPWRSSTLALLEPLEGGCSMCE